MSTTRWRQADTCLWAGQRAAVPLAPLAPTDHIDGQGRGENLSRGNVTATSNARITYVAPRSHRGHSGSGVVTYTFSSLPAIQRSLAAMGPKGPQQIRAGQKWQTESVDL